MKRRLKKAGNVGATLLDTSFLVDVLRGKGQVYKLIPRFQNYSTSSITVFELWKGAIKSVNRKKNKDRINFLLSYITVVDFDSRAAKHAATIENYLGSIGKPIDVADLLIAGTAISHHQTILTRNSKHFSRIPGIKLTSY